MSLSKTDKYILEELKKLVRVYNDKIILDELKAIIEVYNDKWITIHPHGEDSDDYRRIKLEDGETPKEAIDRIYKKDKKEKSEDDLKAEKKQLYQDILKAKKDGNKELHHKLLERYKKVDALLKGQKQPQKETQKQESISGNGLLPKYANDFFDKKRKRDEAREKWHKLLAEYQEKAKDDPKFREFDKQLQVIYNKMREHSRYDFSFQELVNQKNKILDQKHAYEREFYKEVYAAQEEYSSADTSIDKKDIIQKMSGDIKKQITKISSNNNALVEKLNKIDTSSDYDKLKKQDAEYSKKQNELYEQIIKLSILDPKRVELKAEYKDYAQKRGEIIKQKKEVGYKIALQVSKLLQVENGVNLDTSCGSTMQEITDKLKKCLNGVIPSTNFNNAPMKVRKHEGRAFQSGSTINISANEDIGTAIHETMHHLEEHSDHVLMNSLAFATSRTEGEKQESLKRLTGLGYKANEVCKKDKFFNPYCGKLYDSFGGRNKNFINSDASEVMSMGVQELFTNPKEFAKNDREYFDFVVANLQGRLWN